MNRLFAWMALACLLTVASTWDLQDACAKRIPAAGKGNADEADRYLEDPIEYVLGKLKNHDLVMIGERHWCHQEPVFIQGLIKRCFEENAVNVVLIEFGNFEDQGKIDAFMASGEYDRKPIIDCLRNYGGLGWGYQEYFDIFKLIYDDDFAKRVWDRFREGGYLDRLPPELSKWKDKAPTGAELTWMVEEHGLR